LISGSIKDHNFSKKFYKEIFKQILNFKHFGSHFFIALFEECEVVIQESKKELISVINDSAVIDLKDFVKNIERV
jgi:hypothetical protein